MHLVKDADILSESLIYRFTPCLPSQTYRARLNGMKKQATEPFQRFASRIQDTMMKAFPDIINSETFEQLSIQHFLEGLPDEDVAYEVIKTNPKTLVEAENSLIWFESCKQSTRMKCDECLKHTSNASFYTDENYEEEEDFRDNHSRRFVTEERFIELTKVTNEMLSKLTNKTQPELRKMFSDLRQTYIGRRAPSFNISRPTSTSRTPIENCDTSTILRESTIKGQMHKQNNHSKRPEQKKQDQTYCHEENITKHNLHRRLGSNQNHLRRKVPRTRKSRKATSKTKKSVKVKTSKLKNN
ncbi:hypothetical protein DPMN_073841 [Dreissena polymorpha]|uniref:Uncharacterized protein n=1 Tax=Dreissena polymorpha TaxID=45954 RepID=A0A9D4BZY3_DREPO|nr:hypothetical protein DPMN_073841 [Dreissena polymorpha]